QGRTAAAPIEFAAGLSEPADELPFSSRGLAEPIGSLSEAITRRSVSLDSYEVTTPSMAAGQDLGELFQYVIQTPVTVGRGQSTMVPIISARLSPQKELIYNESKLPGHPVATLRVKNETGLTLERGPVTVFENGNYVGEAMLAFTSDGGDIVIPYAAELGVKVQETSGSRREAFAARIDGAYLRFEQWHITSTEYRASNTTTKAHTI